MPGIWHNNMENKFPETMREIKFFCSSNYNYINTYEKFNNKLNKKLVLYVKKYLE